MHLRNGVRVEHSITRATIHSIYTEDYSRHTALNFRIVWGSNFQNWFTLG